MRGARGTLLALGAALCTIPFGCTSFGTVRSAEVHPGPSVVLQASLSTPPGNEASWFWSLDCGAACDHAIPSVDLSLAVGKKAAFALGGGINGAVYPYVEGYVQLRSSGNPFGVGARLGIPLAEWSEHMLYGRYDIRLQNGRRILLNPALFYHTGNSPNGENPGRFLAWVQGIGYLIERENVSFIPSASLIVGRGERESYGESIGPFWTVFGTVSMSLAFHAPRD